MERSLDASKIRTKQNTTNKANMKTTRFIRGQENYILLEQPCHDGIGPWKMKSVIEDVEMKDQVFIKFIHDDIIPPGSSFGYHQHKSDLPEEEWYYCLEGEGIMTLDGEDHDMKPGDISVCYANGFHGIRNTGNKNMRILVICATPIAK